MEDNTKRFNQRQVKEAKAARYYQNTIAISTRALLKSIDGGLMRNSPISRDAVCTAQYIWGISRPYLQGKSTRQRVDAVQLDTKVITVLPPEILPKYKHIVIGIDIMYANGIPFLTTISRTIQFGTTTEMSGATMDNVLIALRVIASTYESRVFKIMAIAADNGFSALENNPGFIVIEITLNLTAEDEHEPYVERFNRTIKEKCRMCIAGIPFVKLLKRMVVRWYIVWYYGITSLSQVTISRTH